MVHDRVKKGDFTSGVYESFETKQVTQCPYVLQILSQTMIHV